MVYTFNSLYMKKQLWNYNIDDQQRSWKCPRVIISTVCARCNCVHARDYSFSYSLGAEEGGETEDGRRAAIIGKLKKHINTRIRTRTITEFRFCVGRSAFFLGGKSRRASSDCVLTTELCDKHEQLEMFWTQQRKL